MKINLDLIVILLFLITTLLLNPLLGSEVVRYIDEGLLLFAVIRIIFQFNRLKNQHNNYKFFKKIIMIIIGITIIGFISNYLSKLVDYKAAIIDWIGIVKLPIVFIYVSCLVAEKTKEKISNVIYKIALIFIPIAFIFGIINLFMDIGMTYDIRYGIRSYGFIYRNPAALNEAIFCLLSTIYKKKSKYTIIYSLFGISTVLFTLRGAALGLLAVFIYLAIILKNNIKVQIKIHHIFFVVLLALFVGKNQFNHYILNESPRSILLNNSFKVANRYFPLGSGFATYGSDQAFKNYSILYKEFGYNDIYWLSEKAGYAANDNFWPMIIGQLGYIGALLYGALLAIQFKYIINNRVNKEEKLIQLVLFILLLISSLGNAIFTSVSGMMVYICVGLLMINSKEEHD